MLEYLLDEKTEAIQQTKDSIKRSSWVMEETGNK